MGDAGDKISDPAGPVDAGRERVFLLVVDDSPELAPAMRFAAQRALHTGGRVALLYVIPKGDFQHWMAVGELMREEARQEAEQVLDSFAAKVREISGKMPLLYVREGDAREEVLKLMDEEPAISVLVLGAATGAKGPGPLVSHLSGKALSRLRAPMTIVSGALGDDEIDALT